MCGQCLEGVAFLGEIGVAPSTWSAPQLPDVAVGRMHDQFDLRGQCFEGMALLGVILVPVVNAAHAADDVAEAALGMVALTPARLISERAVRRRS